ncbi:MAG: hypothetical protein OXC60_18490 [Litoreibacter sp.]|nr:hypothetical protein [Litoreibacter sp.]
MAKKFSGKIRAISSEGREAIVELDKDVSGMKYAVVSYGTKGRIKVMNGKGKLEADTKVKGTAVESVDALRALSIELAE